MRREQHVTGLTKERGGRADRLNFHASLPEFPLMSAWGAKRHFALLLGEQGRSQYRNAAPNTSPEPNPLAIPSLSFAELRVVVANSPEQLEAAHGLVRRRYAWRGYEVEAVGDAIAARAHPRFEQEITFVAENCATTVGTVTLGLDGPLGLRADETHGDVIHKVRTEGRRVCELTRLAVEESINSKSVLASLFSLVYAAGRTMHDVTDVFIEVNPRHVVFYSRILGFVAAAGERFCERVRAPSVLLQLEIEALAERLEIMAERITTQHLFAQAA